MTKMSKKTLSSNPSIKSRYLDKMKLRKVMIQYLIVFNQGKKYFQPDMKHYLKLITKHKDFTIS